MKPGASEQVTVNFTSKSLAGDFTKRITVMSNDPKHAREVLTAKGKVLVPFKATPSVANFRDIDNDTSPIPQTVEIKRGDGGPLKLNIVGTGQPGIDAYLEEVRPGEHYRLIIGLTPPMQSGRMRSWVKLSTGIEQMPETTVPVYGEIPAGWGDTKVATTNQ
ncbi:MAG TPA: DUF1573 domain-containing protein [Phycisphaerae bacterium]|nr:DUF1573 domain-containing protein [Phycisphaerae bacterium]